MRITPHDRRKAYLKFKEKQFEKRAINKLEEETQQQKLMVEIEKIKSIISNIKYDLNNPSFSNCKIFEEKLEKYEGELKIKQQQLKEKENAML